MGIRRGIRSIRNFVSEVRKTIKTVRSVIKNAKYYFRLFKDARKYMSRYKRYHPVPRSMLPAHLEVDNQKPSDDRAMPLEDEDDEEDEAFDDEEEEDEAE